MASKKEMVAQLVELGLDENAAKKVLGVKAQLGDKLVADHEEEISTLQAWIEENGARRVIIDGDNVKVSRLPKS